MLILQYTAMPISRENYTIFHILKPEVIAWEHYYIITLKKTTPKFNFLTAKLFKGPYKI